MSKPRTLSTLVPALVKESMGKKGLLFGKMLAEWSHIAGDDIAACAVPLELKFAKTPDKKNQAVLHMAVESARALEVSYQKALLIERLNMFFGYNAIKDIKITQRSLIMDKKPPRPRARPLSLGQQQNIDALVAGIKENDLQIALKNLGKAILSHQNSQDTETRK